MPHAKSRALLIFALLCAVLTRPLVLAQTGAPECIEGRIVSDRPVTFDHLTVEITSATVGGPMARAAVAPDGSFTIERGRQASSDWIEIIVLTRDATVIHRESVALSAGPVTLRLAGEPFTKPVQGTISLGELKNPPGKKFLKAMRRSQQALVRNDLEKSARHLLAAAALEPGRLDAHLRLGVLLLRMNDHAGALDAFQAAAAIAPNSEPALAGLAISMHGVGRLGEAERQARSALTLYPDSARCHYVLGLVRAQTGHHDDDVVEHLQKASREYPQALLVAAHVYSRRGQPEKAKEALRSCVQSLPPDSAHHAACRERLRGLNE